MRAGPALPSYLALLHAGFSVPPTLLPGRWALTPPFHPCQMRSTVSDGLRVLPKACRRGASNTGGLFSVALSVVIARLCKLPMAVYEGAHNDPLALSGALPIHPEKLPVAVSKGDRSPDFPPAPISWGRRSPGSPAASIIRYTARRRAHLPMERLTRIE